MADSLINLAITGPYQNLFTYKISKENELDLNPGVRFLVPFGKGLCVGYFVSRQNEPVAYRLKHVKQRIDPISLFPEYLFNFCLWISDYYYASPGETLASALPGMSNRKPKIDFSLINRSFFESFKPDNIEIAELVHKLLSKGLIREETVTGKKKLTIAIQNWLEKGVIKSQYRIKAIRKKVTGYRLTGSEINETIQSPYEKLKKLEINAIYSRNELLTEFGLTQYQITKFCKDNTFEKVFDESGVSEISNYPIRYELPKLKLMEGQRKALDKIIPAVAEKKFKPFLLYGVTGSGKTLVYCYAARKAVKAGCSVLVMVPEIALSGLLLSSFAAFFGDKVTVIHSGLTGIQRQTIREKIASGEIKIVIGPRSAIFAPLKNPGLIIVDEEHDPSYKQDDPAPRYHGRDAAVMLARMANIPIILGSASPSVESYHNAQSGRYQLILLDQRPKSGYRMPEIKTLDMKSEKISGECNFLSYRLKRETENHVKDGGQVIYYLNRRGFSPRIKCRNCGWVPACEDCGITYTYHRDGNSLKCHFCDNVEPTPSRCIQCGATSFDFIGTGTQRVEDNLARLFGSETKNNIKAQRIDSDRAARKSGRLILSDFADAKFNLLIGTQMVTKGLDIHGVSLVGVLSADIGLDMPDFRAAEKTYARLLQVAGRAGRGERDGVVLIQTYYTDHPVIVSLSEGGDYNKFIESVIAQRKELFYPPFSRLINITLLCEDEKLLEKEILAFRFKAEEKLTGLNNFKLLGPSKAPLYKLRKQFRRRLIIKCTSIKKVCNRFRHWESAEKSFGLPSKIRIIFDIDPINMM